MLTPTSGKRSRLPFEAGRRVLDVAAVVEAALDQHAAGADRLRVFGDERPLLRERRATGCSSNERSRQQQERMRRHQNVVCCRRAR